jgi:Tol biopolymer transport system component
MKTFIKFAFLLFPLSGTMAQTCNNYWAEVSPDGLYLYFVSDRDGSNYELYRTDIDGFSNTIRLTNSAGNKLYPSLSPDGSKIAFQHGDYNGSTEIYVINNDGSNLLQLTNNSVYDGYPNFSPDGQKIVFAAWDNEQYPEIFTMDADGNNRLQITNQSGAYWQSAPTYNRAGDKIYFQEGYNADDHLVMMDLDGTNWVDITPPNSFGIAEANLHFSPDGSKMIFLTTEYVGYNNGSDLIIADTDGSNWNQITTSSGGDWFYQASYHPTLNKLYYTYISSGSVIDIYSMNFDGTNSELLTNCSLVDIAESIEDTGFSIYPNPANNRVMVTLPAADTQSQMLRIIDALGKVVFEKQVNINTKQLEVDVTDFANGIYFVNFPTGNLYQNSKLIIAK